ncbi:MAG: glycogen-binding domain-containing protein [Gemmatimonadota bacterium]
MAVEGRLSGVTSGAGTGSGAGQLSVEGLWAAPRCGLAIGTGPAAGWVTGDPSAVTAWRARLRGWWQNVPGRLQLTGSVEPARFLGAWFTDVGAGLVARSQRLEFGVASSARLSRRYGSKAAGLGTIELRMSPRVTLEGAVGNVLPDPYQALPASGFVTVGARFHLSPHSRRSDEVVRSRTFSAFRRGDGILVRIRLRDARVVTIAGDWNGWTPAPLERTDGDVWESTFPLTAGPHRFVVFVDDAAWQIPEGVPSVPDGMGGRVAVLTVF